MEQTMKLKDFGFVELNNSEIMAIDAGGPLFGIATAGLAIGTIAMTIAFPPAGGIVLVGIVAGEAIAGTVSTVLAWKA